MSSKARRTLVSVAAAVLVAAPAAQAMPVDAQQNRAADLGSTISRGMEYGDLRVARTQDRDAAPAESRPAVRSVSAPAGFDWLSAAIGAAVAAGLALVSWKALGTRRTLGRREAGA